MIYKDIIFGEFELEDILAELIQTKAMQRLQGVHQAGAAYLVHENWTVNRLEHSIGVMLLIRRFGGTIEEQIAGLLHDVSHTSFSHVVDYLVGDKKESYHDQIFMDTIQKSDILDVISSSKYRVEWINLEKYTLLEQPSPFLCADRIDYFLRDMQVYGYISSGEVASFLDNLIVLDGRFIVKTEEAGIWYMRKYQAYVENVLLDTRNIYSAWRMTRILRYALDHNYITLNMLQVSTDSEMMAHLKSVGDESLMDALATLHPWVSVTLNEQKYDFHMTGKTRIIDPLVASGEGVLPISKINEEARTIIQFLTKRYENGSFIQLIHV
ncbi:HD domain-containing protein [Listeria weihenstephanensis]|uniref:HD domain-containing protein n=1 Tax=Listeria weihenstephanensis TaxID=1006155 RepID=A0A841Z5Z4_9LIST|nr:HD domain-containing protein [Listeria weihenstephanensis]MBC1499887.1 HD domain-containing protein [Listeria weihenstephanensis]